MRYLQSSGINAELHSTNWWFGAQVRPDNAEALFEIMVKELRAIFDGKLTKDEIDAAKQYRLGRYQRGAQTVGGIGGNYAGRSADIVVKEIASGVVAADTADSLGTSLVTA